MPGRTRPLPVSGADGGRIRVPRGSNAGEARIVAAVDFARDWPRRPRGTGGRDGSQSMTWLRLYEIARRVMPISAPMRPKMSRARASCSVCAPPSSWRAGRTGRSDSRRHDQVHVQAFGEQPLPERDRALSSPVKIGTIGDSVSRSLAALVQPDAEAADVRPQLFAQLRVLADEAHRRHARSPRSTAIRCGEHVGARQEVQRRSSG